MKQKPLSALLAALLVLGVSTAAGAEADFVPLFNGRDLSGWVNINCAPNTFTVRDGLIVSTGVPTGVIRTERQYENFEIELEWRHLKTNGNAGLFVWADPITAPGTPFARAIEVQVLAGRNGDNYTSHGDLFGIHGATFKPDRPHPAGWMRCLPSERRAKPAGEWNHYHVTCSNGVIQLAVNGKVVSGGSESKPRKGYICLESEGSECHFRNLRIKQLPSTNPKPDEIAPLAEGFNPLYTGIDLSGWKQEPGQQSHWQPRDWMLHGDGKRDSENKPLWLEKEYGDFVLICDWRWPEKGTQRRGTDTRPGGNDATNPSVKQKQLDGVEADGSGIFLRGSGKSQVTIGSGSAGSGEVRGYRLDQNLAAQARAAVTPKLKADKPIGEWNRFIITMRGDRLTVNLNGQTVIENAQLPGVPARGRFALQHRGDPIEFANIFVKELE